jgi:hypothetical protein
MNRVRTFVVGLVSMLLPLAALAATPLRYATAWTDATGTRRDVTFDGSVTRGTLTGTIRIDALELSVTGIVAVDGSVTGAVRRPNGTQAATFSGRVGADGVLEGTATYGGRTKAWEAPGMSLPSATAP